MSGVKANLKVILQANEVVIAESENPLLWQQVFAFINGNVGQPLLSENKTDTLLKPPKPEIYNEDEGSSETEKAIARFANALGISVEQAIGACSPSLESPYLQLDMHCWATTKEQTPIRGPGSISPLALAATLLVLWAQHAKFGPITQADAQKVLATIKLRDTNSTRSIQSAGWLKPQAGGSVVLNPARIKKATAVAKAFCAQDWKANPLLSGASD